MVVFRKQVEGINEQGLDRFIARARRAVKLRGTVTVLVTSNAEMKKLNDCFRGKSKPTDVLSFAAADNTKSNIAGDVALSLEIARENAKKLGHPVSDEIKILILHGILHLAGYDHETDGGEMAAEEHRLRKALRLPVGLIERSAAGPRRSLKKTTAAAREMASSPGRKKRRLGRKHR